MQNVLQSERGMWLKALLTRQGLLPSCKLGLTSVRSKDGSNVKVIQNPKPFKEEGDIRVDGSTNFDMEDWWFHVFIQLSVLVSLNYGHNFPQ